MKVKITISAAIVMGIACSNSAATAGPTGGSAGGGGLTIGGNLGNAGGFGGATFGRSSFNAGTVGGGSGVSVNSSFRSKGWGGGLGHHGGWGHGHHGGWNSYRNYSRSYNQFGNMGAGVYYPGLYPRGIIPYNQPVTEPSIAAQELNEEDRVRDSDIRRKDDERRQNLPTSAFVKNYDFSKN